MTKIVFKKDCIGNIISYTMNGHTGFDHMGKDILCAAVSMLAQTALISLNKVCNISEEYIDYTVDESIGYLSVSIPRNLDKTKMDKAQIVFRVLEIGISELASDYSKYITLEYGEV